MKPTRMNDREFRTVYSLNGRTVAHCYDPKKDINKEHEDYLCYLHDRIVPYIENADVSVTFEDNPHKKTNKKEKFGKMFRCPKKADATAVIEALCKLVPAETPKVKKETGKTSTPKKNKKNSGKVFVNVTPKKETPAPAIKEVTA